MVGSIFTPHFLKMYTPFQFRYFTYDQIYFLETYIYWYNNLDLALMKSFTKLIITTNNEQI